MTPKVNIEDYLDEDKELPTQKFFVLSYLLPNKTNELEVPMFKVRGSYKTLEECRTRIERLKPKDKYFNMYISEVGKWGGLYDDETLAKMDDIEVQQREEQLNDMMKGYKENRDKQDVEFEERTNIMKERARYEGTKEGQEYLASLKENPVSVKSRKDMVDKQLEEMEKSIKELMEIKKTTDEAVAQFTEEDLLQIKKFEEKPVEQLANDQGLTLA